MHDVLKMHTALRIGLLLVAGTPILGCGSSARQEQSRETAAQSYRTGISALESRDYDSAVEHLTAALESGWLGYSTTAAYTLRAIAQASLGNYDAAHSDLDKAEEGEGASLDTHVARTYVFEKQGQQKEAREAWSQARRLDRRVKKIEH